MPPHCDTLDGPVVTAARHALESQDVTKVFPWISEDQEEEIRQAFQKASNVRKNGAEAKELADYWFFETCVRVHRMMEGAPYTGLKPAGLDEGPAVRTVDECVEIGSVENLLDLLHNAVEEGIRERFSQSMEKKAQAGESVEAARAWVRSYIDFVHQAKAIYDTAEGEVSHEEE
ncbi:DUF6448 family protein [Marinobacter orientalis]|uniref:Uncharacterized protein n=1 Tax=Marinobacter orientalis TaxID=1928859 RepID=A0A7Y0REW0_9GAMM|nr:DUF6448 family protein [Marinobacter orientalis]NMT64965.1 hypothetical protein [Marinobacter orientalis]TGX48142.1 hypothetical protein DIT72_16110 [Marinobacter orientalis]